MRHTRGPWLVRRPQFHIFSHSPPLASLTSLDGGATPAAATVLAAAPFLLGVATDPGALDAGALLAPE